MQFEIEKVTFCIYSLFRNQMRQIDIDFIAAADICFPSKPIKVN